MEGKIGVLLFHDVRNFFSVQFSRKTFPDTGCFFSYCPHSCTVKISTHTPDRQVCPTQQFAGAIRSLSFFMQLMSQAAQLVYVPSHERGQMSDNSGIRAFYRPIWGAVKILYSGFISGSDSTLRIRFPDSSGNDVHADRKYHFKRLFLKNNDFNRDFPLQFSGVLWASDFDTSFR